MDIYTNTFAQHQNLVDYLYAIIDSKIQYVEYELKSKLQSFELQSSKRVDADNRLIRSMELCSHKINLLLLLRNQLNEHNASTVQALINENIYLFHDEESLAQQLLIERPREAPSEDDDASPREGLNIEMPLN